ncbi:FMN-linked oxidoreductase [Colletotrichum zoysiae]|uniref:FMN-linked oxidoreductase n=1 Tax=Colletotrichum zoysiae TaxID=1216348 RepID=A0AAD9HGE6_9PEZI|nr:FMN-linked oxidoreductase [Colletotrichum zoysiae]
MSLHTCMLKKPKRNSVRMRITLRHRVIVASITGNRGVPLAKGTSEKPNRVWLHHGLGGFIYAQLWHTSVATIPYMTGSPTLSASATPWGDDEKFPFCDPVTKENISQKDYPPWAMSLEDMNRTIADFVTAARTAIEFDFDGVEINGCNGNLLDQFLHSNINTRTDAYGGSTDKRARLPLVLLSAPTEIYNYTRGTERVETWTYLCSQIARTYIGKDRLSYMHLIKPSFDRIDSEAERDGFYRSWSPPEVSNLHFRETLKDTPAFTCGWNAVAFAKWFVSNPDLPARLMKGAPLHAYDRSRFCGSWDDNVVKSPKSERDIESQA